MMCTKLASQCERAWDNARLLNRSTGSRSSALPSRNTLSKLLLFIRGSAAVLHQPLAPCGSISSDKLARAAPALGVWLLPRPTAIPEQGFVRCGTQPYHNPALSLVSNLVLGTVQYGMFECLVSKSIPKPCFTKPCHGIVHVFERSAYQEVFFTDLTPYISYTIHGSDIMERDGASLERGRSSVCI